MTGELPAKTTWMSASSRYEKKFQAYRLAALSDSAESPGFTPTSVPTMLCSGPVSFVWARHGHPLPGQDKNQHGCWVVADDTLARIVERRGRRVACIATEQYAPSRGEPPGMKDRIFRPRVPVPESDPVRPRPWGARDPAPDYNKIRWRYGYSLWLRTEENCADLVVVERVMGYDATRHLLWTAQAALHAISDNELEALWSRAPRAELFRNLRPDGREAIVRLIGHGAVCAWLGLPGSRTVATVRARSGGHVGVPAAGSVTGTPVTSRSFIDTQLSAMQQQSSEAMHNVADVHAAAARGTATRASSLPHGEAIQQSFGGHDVSGIRVHTGPEAAASAAAMGAKAYAVGDHVVLGKDADLHTAAHEAAHVVQQRAGVQLKNGVGVAGDPYERHADAVAEKVVRGESAEELLDQLAGGLISAPGVQRQEQMTDNKPKSWPGGPTVARKSTTHTLAEYAGWLRQVEAKYGTGREETLQRLRRLYYSEYTGGVGYRFDALIKTIPGADGPPMTTSDLPLTVINGLYETDAIVTPNGSEIDVSHIFADLDMRVAGGGLKAAVGEARFGVNFEGVFTWAGDLASWWLEAKNAIKKSGAEVRQSDQVAILMGLVGNKVAKNDLLGDLDAQVMADQFTTTTVVPTPEAVPLVITTQNMPLSVMLTRYYSYEPAATSTPAAEPAATNTSAVEKRTGPSVSGRGNGLSARSRFHYFVAGARPRIPHIRLAENPLTVALASDAAAQIREHLAGTARIFINKEYFAGAPGDLTTYGPLLDEVTIRFVRFLTTGLANGDAPWP